MSDRPDPSGRGLGASASKGAAVTLVGQIIRVTVQLTGIVVLARLLAPSDYGLIAMVTAITGIGEVFRDFGLSSAAIQARTISKAQKDNLFWINSGIGLVLALLVCAASIPIAALYGDPRLQPLALVLSTTFVLNGVSTQFRADLNRHLRFSRLMTAEIVGQMLGLVVGVTMALQGFGYWALAGQQVGQGLFQLVLLLFLAKWFPGWITRGVPMRGFLTFGANLVGVQLLVYVSRSIDSVVIGARFGPDVLGLYNRAFQLMTLPLNQINAPSTRVALPVLSRLQDQPARFAAFVLFGQTVMLNVVSFVLAYCGAQAYAIIVVAIGPQWLASVPIFQILLVAAFFQTAGYVGYWIFLAKGLTRSNLIFSLVTRPFMILLILLGSNWGVYGVAAAYALSITLIWPIGLWWIRRVSDAPALLLFTNGLRTVVIYGVATVVSYLATAALPAEALVLRLVIGFAALVAVLALIALLVPRYRRDMKSIFDARKYLARSRRPQAGAQQAPSGEGSEDDGRVSGPPATETAVEEEDGPETDHPPAPEHPPRPDEDDPR